MCHTDGANKYIEDNIPQIDGGVDDESAEETAKVNELIRNQINQTKPKKLKKMSNKELVDLNVEISKHVMIKMLELRLFQSKIQARNMQATVNNEIKAYLKES